MSNAQPVDLTDRERDVLRLTAEGFSPAEIARQLVLTPAGVRGAMFRVRAKLGARNTAHAVLIAERYHRHLLKGAIVRHGTEGGVRAHYRHETPLCPDCKAFEAGLISPIRMRPFRPRTAATDRLTPSDPTPCGTASGARRHIRRGERVAELTCGCREAYAAYFRQYRKAS